MPDSADPQTQWTSFGPLALSRALNTIRVGDVPLPLDVTGFEILATLIEHRGAALTGAELIVRVRGSGVADMHRLWSAVATVNGVLGACLQDAGHVAHHPSIGFSLVVPVEAAHEPAAPTASRQPRPPIARRAGPVFGREEAIARIASQVKARRFVSIVGPGGMGKTTVMLAVAQRLAASYRDGVCFVDLAPLSEGPLVPGAVAAAVGVPASGTDIDLAGFLRSRQMLVILDSCEHLVASVAQFVESFLAEAPQVHVLATSREPLRAGGEWVYRLGPIALPSRTDVVTAAEAGHSPAVQLFVERARAAAPSFALTDAVASTVVGICRRLDGIPLAIELAAPRVAELGLQGLAHHVEHRLLLIAGTRRGGPRRHRTIEQLLDWSHDLLSPEERLVLRRLSVFCGTFTLASVTHVAADEQLSPDVATEAVLDLVAKSLVTRTEHTDDAQYRLLDTTRAYMAAKLAADPDCAATHRRHALYVRRLLVEAEGVWERVTRQEWRSIYAGWVNDVRAALDWAFSSEHSEDLGLELTSLSLTLADQTSLMTEFAQRTQVALEVLRRMSDPPRLLAMRLTTLPTYLSLHQNNHGKIASETARILGALELAKAAGAPMYQAGPLTALWVNEFQLGHYAESLRWSEHMKGLAQVSEDQVLAFIATRTAAQTQHFLGRHDTACRLADEVLANAALKIPLAYFPSAVDCRVSMRIVLARSMWMQGRADSAARVVEECLQIAEADTPPALCQALTLAAVPVAMWCGDWALARQRIDRLREHHRAYPFAFWQPWCDAFEAVQRRWSGPRDPSPPTDTILAAAPTMLDEHLPTFAAELLSPATLSRVRHGDVGWCAPEVLRVHAERLRHGGSAATATEGVTLLQQAMALARSQGSLAWELRAATSLAEAWKVEGRFPAALDVLSRVRARFVETGTSADLDRADALLQTLAQSSSAR